MNWPPDEQGWAGILKELPGGDCAAVRAAVEAAVQEFITIAPGNIKTPSERDLWRHLQELAASKGLTNFRNLIKQAGSSIDPSNPDRDRLLHVADELAQLPTLARGWAEFHRPRSRRERFDSAVLLAWTGYGKGKLAASADGPLVRFYCAIADRILSRPVGGEDVKKIVNREKRRRQLLARLGAEGKMKADARVLREGEIVE
jgi:hypothetical protein